MTMTTLRGTRHPFAKLKPGMRVEFQTSSGPYQTGTLLAKHNGSKTLNVLGVEGTVYDGVPYTEYVGTPEPHPLDQIHPMLAKDIAKRKTLSVDEVLASEEWGLEEKYDGERQILTLIPNVPQNAELLAALDLSEFVLTPNNEVYFRTNTRVVGKNTGRLATNSEAVQHLAGIGECVPSMGATVLDVELLHLDGFQTLRSIMGSLPAKAIQRQTEVGQVYATVFDILWFGGMDLRDTAFSERRETLENWFTYFGQNLKNRGLTLSQMGRTEEEKRRMLDELLDRGAEGAMVKFVGGTYTDTTRSGRRSSEVLKIKPFVEDDVIITGFERGRGEYNQHKFGAIKFAQYVRVEDLTEEMGKNVIAGPSPSVPGTIEGHVLVHMGSCSGITDAQEILFREHTEVYIGQAMEVRYQQRWPDTGLMRHPNFIRLRGDKSPKECVYGRDA